jgi:hypothetical protein
MGQCCPRPVISLIFVNVISPVLIDSGLDASNAVVQVAVKHLLVLVKVA